MVRPAIDSPADVEALLGRQLGPGPWLTVEQRAVDAFATATSDRQWIHMDVERARAGRFGGTIAHGHLLLGLAPSMLREILDLRGVTSSINYGCDRVRFPAPAPTGCRLRLWARIASVRPRPDGHLVTLSYRFERDGGERPVCVADCLSLWSF